VTLLIHAPSALAGNADAELLHTLLQRLDARYPLAYSVVASEVPASEPQRDPQREWVSLPRAEQGLWVEPQRTAARVLLAYARQLRPAHTLFLGHGEALRQTCLSLPDAARHFEPSTLLPTLDEARWSQLELEFDAKLPAYVVVSRATQPERLRDDLCRQAILPAVTLCWKGHLGDGVAQLIEVALTHTAGPVTLQVKLKDLAHQQSAVRARQLLAWQKRRLSVVVAGEEGVPLRTGRVLSRLFSGRGKEQRP
jgi:hypothetical protein